MRGPQGGGSLDGMAVSWGWTNARWHEGCRKRSMKTIDKNMVYFPWTLSCRDVLYGCVGPTALASYKQPLLLLRRSLVIASPWSMRLEGQDKNDEHVSHTLMSLSKTLVNHATFLLLDIPSLHFTLDNLRLESGEGSSIQCLKMTTLLHWILLLLTFNCLSL